MTRVAGPSAKVLFRRSVLLVVTLTGAGLMSSLTAAPPTTGAANPRLASVGPSRRVVPAPASSAALAFPAAIDRMTFHGLATRPGRQPQHGTAPGGVPPLPAARPAVDCWVRRCVALTFDDGPAPGTAHLLDILRARRVRATFFVLGCQVAAYPQLLRRESADGHEIGDHSYSHADLSAIPTGAVESEIGRTQKAIWRLTGNTPVLFRPPYGSTDRQVAAVARRHGLAQILWAVDPLDWRDRDSAVVQRRVVHAANSGSIILLHDIHPTTVAAVPGIVAKLSKAGFVFVTVSELYGGKPLTSGRKYTELTTETRQAGPRQHPARPGDPTSPPSPSPPSRPAPPA
ncbi:MAG: polysaccharide deacetylase [Streptosporangiaceae bacterium]|nr:polysaccharide deacetylase [Streptosporangiaceae bacterium]